MFWRAGMPRYQDSPLGEAGRSAFGGGGSEDAIVTDWGRIRPGIWRDARRLRLLARAFFVKDPDEP
jgi:hypothetical protein